MALPDVTLNIQDGALGITPVNGNQTHVKIGVSALGNVNQIYSGADLKTLQTLLGNGGPLVESAALAVATTVNASRPVQAGTVYCVPVNPSVAGTVSSVVKVGAGSETLTVTAKNAAPILVKILTTGTNATATAVFSYDNGNTWTPATTLAATLVLPGCSLVTLAFAGATGAFVAGDVYSISTSGAVTLTGAGTGTVSINAASPVDTYNAQVKFTVGGALGTAQFQYTLDNALTWSPVLLVPSSGTYVIADTGLVLTFASTATAGDYFTFTTTAASYSSSDVTAAMTAILADPRTWAFVHLIGRPSSVSAAASMVATMDTLLSSAASQYRYARGLVEFPKDTDSNLITGTSTTVSTRVNSLASSAVVVSPLNGRQQSRSIGWTFAARAAKIPPSEDPGRAASGLVAGVVSLDRDENATPSLDAGRFTTMRTIIGKQGFYITNGRLMAPNGSDFTWWQNGRVMDIGCAAARAALLPYLNDSLRTNPDGTILEADARAIENNVTGQVRVALTQPGDARGVTFTVSRTQNIVSTSILATTLRIQPLGYAKYITVDIGFANPAFAVSAAA